METQEPALKTLIQACRNGEFEVVKEIVERTGIDVNIDTEYFPLFAAAKNCDLQLIKYLIGKGANVNARTPDNGRLNGEMSPLQAALSHSLDIDSFRRRAAVELLVSNGADPSARNVYGPPMWELCKEDQPDVTLLLVELGMSVTQKSYLTDITLLHRWAASADPAAISIIELILAKGADLKALNKIGISPLNIAAVGLPSSEFTYLVPSPYHSPNDPVLRLLLNRSEYSLSEKIDALELAGAKLILHKRDDSSISQAFQYWNEALDLRESAQGSNPKVPLNPNNIIQWRAVEWTTKDQLEELQNHPSIDRVKMQQAILVAQRILSRMSSEALLGYLWYGLASNYCEALYFGNHIAELLDVCWTVFEGARLHDTRRRCLWLTIENLTTILSAALKKLKIEGNNPIWMNSETLMHSLELVTETDISHLPGGQSASVLRNGKHTEYMYVICDLISVISELPELITPEIKSCLERFVRRNGRNKRGDNLFLVACNKKPIPLCLIRLLLDVGADPNSENKDGNSPLHLLADSVADEMESPLADLLLEFGADPDKVNFKKETPLGIWKRWRTGILFPPTWMMMKTVPSLVSLCGRTVRRSGIPVHPGELPDTLRTNVLKD